MSGTGETVHQKIMRLLTEAIRLAPEAGLHLAIKITEKKPSK